MVLAHGDDKFSYDSSSSNSIPSAINFTFNLQTRLVDYFSWHGRVPTKAWKSASQHGEQVNNLLCNPILLNVIQNLRRMKQYHRQL